MSKSYYDYKGFELPRVTSICDQMDKSPALMGWAIKMMGVYLIEQYAGHPTQSLREFEDLVDDAKVHYKAVSQEAMDIGSEVHSIIERYLLTGKEPKDPRPEVLSSFVAFLEWKDSVEMEVLEVEHSVYSLDPPYAGTLDLICIMNGVKTYIDFKTSKAVYEGYRYQIAAYRQTDEFPDRCGSGVLLLNKESGYPEYKDLSKKYDNDVDIFNDLCKLWWKRKPKLRKKYLDNGGIL